MGDNLALGLVVGCAIGFFLAGLVGFVSSRILWHRGRERIAIAESKAEAEPEKAKPAWDLARATLEAYFNQNLSQINYIFLLSVGVMIVGFGIIIWGISQAIQSPSTVVPAAIASAAGVITEFIGATFLFVYRSTIQQASSYSKTLERINSVGMAMQILDTIPDGAKPDDLKNKTKAALVELLIRQEHQAVEKTEDNKGKSTRERG
jgi:hypothetical protein